MSNRSIRGLPAWQIKARLKRAGIRQVDVGKAVGVSLSLVSATINRDATPTDTTERIWQELERVLNGTAAVVETTTAPDHVA